MRNLYDVYKAIQADEGDHVTAMKACLDPNIRLVSPSVERRLVTAAALFATLGLLVNGGGSPSDVGIDTSAIENFSTEGIAETAVSGLAALLSQIMGGTSTDTVEGVEGAVEATELFLERASAEKALSLVVGGLTWLFGTSILTNSAKDDSSGSVEDCEDDSTKEEGTT